LKQPLPEPSHKQLATEFPDAEQFRIGVNLAWEKLDKYYNLLNETPIYYTALALHPAYRWDWFEEIWKEKPEWITKAKAIVHEVWIRDYSQLDLRTSSRESSDESPPAKDHGFFTLLRLTIGYHSRHDLSP
jgi:hypothetical protein